MGEQRWKAAQWMWESESEVCRSEIETARAENLIRDLVERGGWMVLGGEFALFSFLVVDFRRRACFPLLLSSSSQLDDLVLTIPPLCAL